MINYNDYLKKLEKQDLVLTKFLDTNESSQLHQIKNSNIEIYFYGGYEDAERTRAILIKKGTDAPISEEFEIGVLKITPCSTIRPITHRHVLGTIMSLGVKRDIIGDIIVSDTENNNIVYVFVNKLIEEYIKNNLMSINNTTVEVSTINLNDFVNNVSHNEQLINVASLRLDGVISHVMRISRNKAEQLIKTGNVQINHIDCLNIDKQLKMDDIISIKHFGRITLLDIVNKTKKQRLIIKIDIKH